MIQNNIENTFILCIMPILQTKVFNGNKIIINNLIDIFMISIVFNLTLILYHN